MKVNEVRIADPERIRKLVEEKVGKPAQVTEGDSKGELRIEFPGEENSSKTETISWDRFFEKFRDRNLVFTRSEQLTLPEREA